MVPPTPVDPDTGNPNTVVDAVVDNALISPIRTLPPIRENPGTGIVVGPSTRISQLPFAHAPRSVPFAAAGSPSAAFAVVFAEFVVLDVSRIVVVTPVGVVSGTACPSVCAPHPPTSAAITTPAPILAHPALAIEVIGIRMRPPYCCVDYGSPIMRDTPPPRHRFPEINPDRSPLPCQNDPVRVLVTGAAGYLGRAVIAALHAAGHEPIAMARTPGTVIPGAAEVRPADLLDPAALARAVDSVDAVCHLAGLARARESIADPLRYFRANTTATLAVLEAMSAAAVGTIVFASTAAIYGAPDRQPMTEDLPDAPPHPYAQSKLAAELAIQAATRTGELSAVILRLSNIAGGSDRDLSRLIPRAVAAAVADSPLPVNGDGTATRDYLHVEDAARAFIASLHTPPHPGTATRYTVGSGRGTTILEVAAAVRRVTGVPLALDHRPPASEPPTLIVDPSTITAETGWKPIHSTIDEIVGDAWRAITESPLGVRPVRTSGF
ncbi:NAD-dependent epimerase/dehydratase family protein [Nocardia sp. CA-145437]|uniref:NAD-dependent epimerase/dehydratase family protein n=1 Tax=Nocardia sp. CA-145437 TaxID=3239980 RepID=UPI003D96D79E